MQISVVGGGYIGLVTAACFAELGHNVRIIEIDVAKVKAINSGKSPIYEKGLEKLLFEYVGSKLNASSVYEGISDSDISFICVGTPPDLNGKQDLTAVKLASESIGKSLIDCERYHVVAVKSTVVPGTTESVIIPMILEKSALSHKEIGFAMNPEFLREGLAIHDFLKPDRIVIGSLDTQAGDIVESAYYGLNAPILHTGITEAEMIKYVSNAFLATKISFSNEIGNICKRLRIDVYEVMRGVGMDHRISPHFLNAGVGFGGSCFPKDVTALMHLAKDLGEDAKILESVMDINERQPLKMIELLEDKIGNIVGKRIAILGLAFKNDTDDVRESRSIPIIEELINKGATVMAYDPKANISMKNIFPDITYCESAFEALNAADACMIMTEWPEFSALDSEFNFMKSRVIIEGRKILTCKDVEGVCW